MINDPVVVAELTALHTEYETALVSNDVQKLQEFFWDSPWALRFGIGENLYGSDQIADFRRNRSPVDLARETLNVQVVTFGEDCGVVTLEFIRNAGGMRRHGRQSQVWRKFEPGWKIVSAHVSFMAQPYRDFAAAMVRLPLPESMRGNVHVNLDRSSMIAATLLDFPLSELNEGAAVFEP